MGHRGKERQGFDLLVIEVINVGSAEGKSYSQVIMLDGSDETRSFVHERLDEILSTFAKMKKTSANTENQSIRITASAKKGEKKPIRF